MPLRAHEVAKNNFAGAHLWSGINNELLPFLEQQKSQAEIDNFIKQRHWEDLEKIIQVLDEYHIPEQKKQNKPIDNAISFSEHLKGALAKVQSLPIHNQLALDPSNLPSSSLMTTELTHRIKHNLISELYLTGDIDMSICLFNEAMLTNHSLKRLHIVADYINAHKAKLLAHILLKHKNITEFGLFSTSLTEEGAKTLYDLFKQLPSIRKIYLWGGPLSQSINHQLSSLPETNIKIQLIVLAKDLVEKALLNKQPCIEFPHTQFSPASPESIKRDGVPKKHTDTFYSVQGLFRKPNSALVLDDWDKQFPSP